MENIIFTKESVKRQITDSINVNLTDSDLESIIDVPKRQFIAAELFEFRGNPLTP